ncbi:MAG: HEPN domain-containing protein [Spirochaetales bacterium]|jgi:HEPN domain-containing protein|nr:HEPN domain-containing protein [Spirochaetales bacterium]
MANKPEDWCFLADRDLRAAEHLASTMRPVPVEIICFHCQQAGEKYLKGFVTLKENKEPPYIHDVAQLCKLCEKYDSTFSGILKLCSILTEFGIQPRYDRMMQLSEDDMHQAVKCAQEVEVFIKTKMPETDEGM